MQHCILICDKALILASRMPESSINIRLLPCFGLRVTIHTYVVAALGTKIRAEQNHNQERIWDGGFEKIKQGLVAYPFLS